MVITQLQRVCLLLSVPGAVDELKLARSDYLVADSLGAVAACVGAEGDCVDNVDTLDTY